MVIYGVSLLAVCTIVGIILGEVFGFVIGVQANVGGVGIAMLILVLVIDAFKKRGRLSMPTQDGLSFWGAMYIPIVVAMAANQNVVGAIEGGPLAITAGVSAVIAGFLFVPLISKIGRNRKDTYDPGEDRRIL
ncbi:malonate transporter MadL subunit [Virgibacillus natechei]|uniref:Malonate transporter MadL subunit n=1 Tax=Virgibacillus natechei TaxID=1216297 RepID=A0ABS4IJ67_9BACI|nr:malonate transporter subunit MadL [Virgibacillus natechei]MBP1970029.1 malonate transporter MadL subunit [Virgibacillus natechei]UZD14115.1 malonate transporter subunit MadL [Virgibacillus natechei]